MRERKVDERQVAAAKRIALQRLASVEIEDTFTVKLRDTSDPHWVAQYRAFSQFKSRPIFWVSANTREALREANGYDPTPAEVVETLATSILHEYGHVIAEYAWTREPHLVDVIRRGWPGEHEALQRDWDEESFAEDFARWLGGRTGYDAGGRLSRVTRMYAEAFST